MEVPGGNPVSSTLKIFPPLISTIVPETSSCARVSRRRRETEAIEGKASPRKPRVATLSKSSALLIFDVAWRSKASSASSRTIPQPLSVIWISFLPPASIWILMRVEPASSAFSSSSLTTEAGRSTTSPAAILLATASERTWILPMMLPGSSGAWRLLLLYLDPQITQLEVGHRGGCIHHEVLGCGSFWERDHLAQALGAGEDHDDAVQSQGDTAVGRSAVLEGFEEESEARLGLLFGHAEGVKDFPL